MESIMTRNRSAGLVAALLAASAAAESSASPQVFLNELKVRGQERVELHNREGTAVDLAGWRIVGRDTFVVPEGTVIPAHGYAAFDSLGDIFDLDSAEAGLIDATGEELDRVSFGQGGSAPLPHDMELPLPPAVVSLARSPDAGGFSPPPAPDAAFDGIVWTLDLDATFGAPNDAREPRLGTALLINEVGSLPTGEEFAELFNPDSAAIGISGWFLTNGDSVLTLDGLIPGGETKAIVFPAGFLLDTFGLLYLFAADSARVDQVGFWDVALLQSSCLARCPDGTGPNLGYNYDTSGGGTSFFVVACTPGSPNGDCRRTHVGSPANERLRWSSLRRLFR